MIFPFVPNQANIPSQFQPTLDGNIYQALLWWNVAAQRVYITLNDQSNTAIFSMPLIESPLNYPISMTTGYFASTLVYYPDSQQIEVLP